MPTVHTVFETYYWHRMIEKGCIASDVTGLRNTRNWFWEERKHVLLFVNTEIALRFFRCLY